MNIKCLTWTVQVDKTYLIDRVLSPSLARASMAEEWFLKKYYGSYLRAYKRALESRHYRVRWVNKHNKGLYPIRLYNSVSLMDVTDAYYERVVRLERLAIDTMIGWLTENY